MNVYVIIGNDDETILFRWLSNIFSLQFQISIAIFNSKTDWSKGVCHVSSVIFAHVPEAACCNHLSASIASYTHSFPPMVNSAGLAGFAWQKRRPERERPKSKKRKRIGGLVNRASLKMPLDILRLSSNISCFNPRKFYLGIVSREMLKLVQ